MIHTRSLLVVVLISFSTLLFACDGESSSNSDRADNNEGLSNTLDADGDGFIDDVLVDADGDGERDDRLRVPVQNQSEADRTNSQGESVFNGTLPPDN